MMRDMATTDLDNTRAGPAGVINPVRGIIIGLVVLAIIGGVLVLELGQAKNDRPTDFLGFVRPRPGTVLQRSAPMIAVNFNLGGFDGTPLTKNVYPGPGLGSNSIVTRVQISGRLDGAAPLGTARCHGHSAGFFACALPTPTGVRADLPYYVSVYEQVDGRYVVMPMPSGSPNSLLVRFG
jgi:hypothetical protein